VTNKLEGPYTVGIFIVRNLHKIPSADHSRGWTFQFEVQIHGEWKKCGPAVCGNCTAFTPPNIGTVLLGWDELNKAYDKHDKRYV